MKKKSCDFFQSQTSRILRYLESGRGLTAPQAYNKGWGMRLSGRIFDLRAKGNVIESYMINAMARGSRNII